MLGVDWGRERYNNVVGSWNKSLDRSQAPVSSSLLTKGIRQLYKAISRLYLWLGVQQSCKDIVKGYKKILFFQLFVIVM